MSTPLPQLLQPTLDRLVRALSPERIVLFGSYAKGTAGPQSDIDLLVVAKLEGETLVHLRRARQLIARSFPRVDLLLCKPEDLIEADAGRSPFLQSVLWSGTTVYERVGRGQPVSSGEHFDNPSLSKMTDS